MNNDTTNAGPVLPSLPSTEWGLWKDIPYSGRYESSMEGYEEDQMRAYGLQCWNACDEQVAGPLRQRIAELERERDEDRRREYGYSQQTVDAISQERDHLHAKNEALKSLLREVSCVGITQLYDTDKQDVLAEFTIPELQEVVASTEHLRSLNVTVESIYRRGFDAARAAREEG